MRARTLIASLLVVASVGILAWTLLFGGSGSSGNARGIVGRDLSPNPNLQFKASFAEAAGGTGRLGAAEPVSTSNMTDALIASYLKTLGGKNPSGPKNGTLALPSADTVAGLIAGGTENSGLSKPITERDIRVGKDDSPAAQKIYIETISNKLKARMGAEKKTLVDALSDLANRADSSALLRLATISSGYVTDLLEISAPPSFAVIHLDRLNLWKEKVAVYQAIAERDADPFRAYVAASELTLIAERDADLATIILNRYADVTK